MASREENNLKKVIDEYFEENEKKKKLEGELKKKNSFIKSKLTEMNLDLYETDTNKATITYQNRVSMDDDKIIEILKENVKKKDLTKVIKTKEYVDYEELESLIYNGLISAEKLEPANTTTVIATLKVVQRKKEKADE